MEFIIALVSAGIIMGILDFMWLKFGARKLYETEMPGMLLDKPKPAPAAIFYILYVIGVVYFVVAPALETDMWMSALYGGALFGLVAYGTYGLTNLAVFKNFSAKAIAIDMAWGTLLAALMGVGAYASVQLFM